MRELLTQTRLIKISLDYEVCTYKKNCWLFLFLICCLDHGSFQLTSAMVLFGCNWVFLDEEIHQIFLFLENAQVFPYTETGGGVTLFLILWK